MHVMKTSLVLSLILFLGLETQSLRFQPNPNLRLNNNNFRITEESPDKNNLKATDFIQKNSKAETKAKETSKNKSQKMRKDINIPSVYSWPNELHITDSAIPQNSLSTRIKSSEINQRNLEKLENKMNQKEIKYESRQNIDPQSQITTPQTSSENTLEPIAEEYQPKVINKSSALPSEQMNLISENKEDTANSVILISPPSPTQQDQPVETTSEEIVMQSQESSSVFNTELSLPQDSVTPATSNNQEILLASAENNDNNTNYNNGETQSLLPTAESSTEENPIQVTEENSQSNIPAKEVIIEEKSQEMVI